MRPFLDTRGLVNKAKLLFSRILRMLSKSFQQPPLCGVTTPQSHYQPQELVCTTILIKFSYSMSSYIPRVNVWHQISLLLYNCAESSQPTSTIFNRSTRRDCLQPGLLFTILHDISIATLISCADAYFSSNRTLKPGFH